MLHKNVLPSHAPVLNHPASTSNPTGLTLVSASQAARADQLTNGRAAHDQVTQSDSSLLELAVITSRRCSSFFAEAAVLVLVFGILDYFMLKGRIELPWIVGALGISLGLLGASIAMDFSAHRWIKAHP
jgi:hypothetical protein